MAHTPGPWTYGGSHWGRWQIDSAKDDNGRSFHIAELVVYTGLGGTEGAYNEQQKANARLIAAAPELLEALKELGLLIDFAEPASAEMPMAFDDYGPLNEAFEKARAAIAKAEGRE